MRRLFIVGVLGVSGCFTPADVRNAPDSPVKNCQEAFLCARKCYDCIGDDCQKDSACVANCAGRFQLDSPCSGGRPPAEFGADLAWGCEGDTVDKTLGSDYVTGLCTTDAMELCACAWKAYECTGAVCTEPGIDDTGDDTMTDTDMTGTDMTGTDGTGTDGTGTDGTGTDGTGTDSTDTGGSSGGW